MQTFISSHHTILYVHMYCWQVSQLQLILTRALLLALHVPGQVPAQRVWGGWYAPSYGKCDLVHLQSAAGEVGLVCKRAGLKVGLRFEV